MGRDGAMTISSESSELTSSPGGGATDCGPAGEGSGGAARKGGEEASLCVAEADLLFVEAAVVVLLPVALCLARARCARRADWMMTMASSCAGLPSAWAMGLGTRGTGELWSGRPGMLGGSEPRALLAKSFVRATCPLKAA